MALAVHRLAVLLLLLVVTLLGYSTLVAAGQEMAIGSAVAEELANTTSTRHLQTYSSTGFQTLMLNAVNKQGTANGLAKLCMNKKLQTAAQGHSSDMAAKNYMSHTGSDGSTMSQRITAAGTSGALVPRTSRPARRRSMR
ncbi:hypothetical protein PF004_g16019 [Phytophthora fragariae]|uniref:SCP domain-containing protein n=1 Tax=Phytophthora fragariae TaxID=53985 RepID=A0A6G0NJJ6_9STRA|nr:hypothetical protein PF004_g16019 [Phytophthora fragariae]